MSDVASSHQVVRLERGRHRSPARGACVMELASVLANERFTDRPRSVCVVLGGFLRAYNDAIDDTRRQDLYRYASVVVGTRSSDDVTRARARRAVEWGRATYASRGRLARWFDPRPPALVADAEHRPETAGAFAAYAALRAGAAHEDALAFVDELVGVGADAAAWLLPSRFDVADVVPGELVGALGTPDAARDVRRASRLRSALHRS